MKTKITAIGECLLMLDTHVVRDLGFYYGSLDSTKPLTVQKENKVRTLFLFFSMSIRHEVYKELRKKKNSQNLILKLNQITNLEKSAHDHK